MASKVAEALVEIRATNAALRSDMAQTRGIVTSTMGSIGAAARGLGAAITAALGPAAAAIAGVMGIRQMIAASIEGSEAQIRLEAAVKQTGDTISFTVEQLNAMAKQIQATTNFGDEAINRAQAVLLRVEGMTTANFEKTLNTAKDLAAFMGGDIDAAAQTLAISMSQPTAAMRQLRAAGIMFNATQREQIQNFEQAGNLAGAQAIIMGRINEVAGGMAERLANPFAQAKNSIGDMVEEIGTQLMPAFSLVANIVKEIADGITGLVSGISSASDSLAESFAGLGEFVGVLPEGTSRNLAAMEREAEARRRAGPRRGTVPPAGPRAPAGPAVPFYAENRPEFIARQRADLEAMQRRDAAAAALREVGERNIQPPLERAAEKMTASFSGLTNLWQRMQESISQVRLEGLQQRQVSETIAGNNDRRTGNELLRQINDAVRRPRPATAG